MERNPELNKEYPDPNEAELTPKLIALILAMIKKSYVTGTTYRGQSCEGALHRSRRVYCCLQPTAGTTDRPLQATRHLSLLDSICQYQVESPQKDLKGRRAVDVDQADGRRGRHAVAG